MLLRYSRSAGGSIRATGQKHWVCRHRVTSASIDEPGAAPRHCGKTAGAAFADRYRRREPGALGRDGGPVNPYLDEWRRILDGPLEDFLRLIEQEGERMTALRQCSPFAGVLEPKERWAIYARFEPDEAA